VTATTERPWTQPIGFVHALFEMAVDVTRVSDVLGVSMRVDAIKNREPSRTSKSTVLGPFHVADAAELPLGADDIWT